MLFTLKHLTAVETFDRCWN